jgi:hypothetical protein
MKHKTIAFDLEGTLLPECGEFSCVRTGGIARLISKRSLRRDAPNLLRSLALAGNHVMIYTITNQSSHSAKKLKLWFWLQGIPITRVITKREHEKYFRDHELVSLGTKAPHLFGIDLLVDDSHTMVEYVRESGTDAVLVTNHEVDWTLNIRIACGLHRGGYVVESG